MEIDKTLSTVPQSRFIHSCT